MTQSILARADRAAICLEPFPHLVVENALAPELYESLSLTYPNLDAIAGAGQLENNKLYLRSAADIIDDATIPKTWRDFFAFHCSQEFFLEVADFWEEQIYRLHPDLADHFGKQLRDFTIGLRGPGRHENEGNRAADIMLDCQFSMNSPVRTVSSVRGPHIDHPAKLFAGLLYFRHEDDDSEGGDLELYRMLRRYPQTSQEIAPEYVERSKSIPYGRNTLVMWLNSASSIHGVSPRGLTDQPRRYVNFLGECYSGSRPNYFTAFPRRGLFGLLDSLRT